jgi:hypothetical protein
VTIISVRTGRAFVLVSTPLMAFGELYKRYDLLDCPTRDVQGVGEATWLRAIAPSEVIVPITYILQGKFLR